jgi:hypothetical protein
MSDPAARGSSGAPESRYSGAEESLTSDGARREVLGQDREPLIRAADLDRLRIVQPTRPPFWVRLPVYILACVPGLAARGGWHWSGPILAEKAQWGELSAGASWLRALDRMAGSWLDLLLVLFLLSLFVVGELMALVDEEDRAERWRRRCVAAVALAGVSLLMVVVYSVDFRLEPFFLPFLLSAVVVGIGACTIKTLSGLRGFFR